MTGMIFDVKELAVHDGPGLRTTVFFKGCPLRCVWCHNPEGLNPKPQLYVRENACTHCGLCQRGCAHPDCQPYGRCLHICPRGLVSVSGKEMEATQLAQKLRRSAGLFGSDGGITFSGGEPLMQPAFLHAVMDALGDIPCALETCGYASPEVFEAAIQRMQLVYLDIKLADDALHRRYTGVSNHKILTNLEILRQSGIPCVIRTPLIPGITDTEANLSAIRALIGDLSWEQLPYNAMAGAKYPLLGMEYPYDKLSE